MRLDRRGPGRPSEGGAAPAVPGAARWAVRVGVLVLLLGALLIVRTTVATPVRVSSASMEPTLAVGNVVLVSQHRPGLDDLDRGDLIPFTSPEAARRTVKRVIGLPGDSLVIKDSVL